MMTNATQNRTLVPAYAVRDEKDAVYLTIEMPGVDKENVDITVENNQLQVRGTRNTEESGRYHIRERRSGDFVRSFTVDDTVDTDHIDASMEHGVLRLKLGMKEHAKPRKIEVKTK
jgi:HSP20 family protein